ncbi:MAG: tetratricopeptide repeat protein [Bacteroidia bacterium]
MKTYGIAVLWLVVIWSAVTRVHAQRPSAHNKTYPVDSLLQANERYDKLDLHKLHLLSVLAKTYDQTRPDEGIKYGRQAIRLAQQLNQELLLAEAYYYTGQCLENQGKYDTSMALYQKAFALNIKLNNAFGAGHNAYSLGYTNLLRGHLEKADKWFENAFGLFEEIQDRKGLARVYHGRSLFYARTGNADTALFLARQSVELNQKLGHKAGIMSSFSSMGFYYFYKSDIKQAIEYYAKALEMAREIGSNKGQAVYNNTVGTLYGNQSDFKQGLSYMLDAIKHYHALGDSTSEAMCSNITGNFYLRLSDYHKALEYYQRAVHLDELLNNPEGVVQTIGNMATAYGALSEYAKAIEYYERAIAYNLKTGNTNGLTVNYSNLGIIYDHMSDYRTALDYFFKALAIREKEGDKSGMSSLFTNIGTIYKTFNDPLKSLNYFQKALEMSEAAKNHYYIAANLGNIGNLYSKLEDSLCVQLGIDPAKKLELALDYYQRSIQICEVMDYKSYLAQGYSSMSKIHEQWGDYHQAHNYNQQALAMSVATGSKASIASMLAHIGEMYMHAPDTAMVVMGIDPREKIDTAHNLIQQALQINLDIGNPAGQRYNWMLISNLYEKKGDFPAAFEAYKTYIKLRDSISSDEVKKQIANRDVQYQFERREAELRFQQELTTEQLQKQELLNRQQEQQLALRLGELELANKDKELQHLAFLKEKAEKQEKEQQLTLAEKDKQLQLVKIDVLNNEKALQQAELRSKSTQRNLFVAGMGLTLLLAGSVLMGLNRTKKAKQQSDALLLNILPAEVAEELKGTGHSEAKLFDEVSVLFTDFIDFTSVAEQLSPTELVSEIHKNFTAFDAIIEKYGLEKIKTIGDAYMAVGGLPAPFAESAKNTVLAALEMQDFIRARNIKSIAAGKPAFEMRVGIHTGPVVAGIVGVKKFQYDIWGDTVNTASRMESSGEVSKVNISQQPMPSSGMNQSCLLKVAAK